MKLVRSHHEVAATNGSDARAETAEDVLRMACSFEFDAALLATSRAIIAESRRSLASSWSERVNDKHDALLANSRATVADSKRLLAAVEAATAGAHKDEAIMMSIATARAGMDRNPATLSVHVFQKESRFSWIVCSPSDEIVGRGTAETELKARADAFCAAMIYLECVKHPSAAGDTILH